MKPIWLIGVVAIGMVGCAPVEKMTGPAAPPEKTVTRQAIEGFTGKTAVDVGERTKAKLKAIETQRQQNFEEIAP